MLEIAQAATVTTGQLIGVGGVLTLIYVVIQIGDRLWGRRQNGNGVKAVCKILELHLELQKSRHDEVMGYLRGGSRE